jgi:hypothetical protein
MYARKVLLRKFIRHNVFINQCPQKPHSLFVPKPQQVRRYSLSSTVLRRSSNNSFTPRDIGQTSKGN